MTLTKIEMALKKIALDTLLEEAGLLKAPYAEQYAHISSLCSQGLVRPIKASAQNGKKPPLSTSYFLTSEKRDDSAYLRELNYDLHPRIRLDFYRRHLAIYARERGFVLALSAFLTTKQAWLEQAMSCNERSFQIWHDEKFLDEKGGRTLLAHCGLSARDLNFYETAEPLPAFTLERSTPQDVLILENLDSFYSLRRLLSQGTERLLGRRFGTLIWGRKK